MQVYSISIFRAIAIAMVVFSHAPFVGTLTINTLPERVVWNVLSGATTMFVFISGFLFSHVFLKRFDFGVFMRKKIKNLVVPYVLLSFVALALGCTILKVEQFEGDFAAISLSVYMLLTGSATLAYWYIPFVLTLFAMAPLHARFAELQVRTQLIIVGVLFVIALLIHRPLWNVGPVQNLLYYTPTYLLGMMCSQHRNALAPHLSRWTWPLLVSALGVAVVQALLGDAGNYGKPMFAWGGLDLMLLQKVLLCLFMLGFLRRFESKRSKTVDLLSETSFAIFFLHPIVIELFVSSPDAAPLLMEESWIQFAVLSTICLFGCAALAWAARRAFGAQSRFVTGY